MVAGLVRSGLMSTRPDDLTAAPSAGRRPVPRTLAVALVVGAAIRITYLVVFPSVPGVP